MSDTCQAKGCKAPAAYTQRVRNATTDRVVRLCVDCWTALMTPYRADPELESEKTHAPRRAAHDVHAAVLPVPPVAADTDDDGQGGV